MKARLFRKRPKTELTNKRTVISFETREFLLVHRAQTEGRSMCDGCNAETDWLTPEQAIVVTGLNAREIFRRVESGSLHFKETTEGFSFICAQSLGETEG
jgi:hypothetical protein